MERVMSNEEICLRYRESADPAVEILKLAQENRCKPGTIRYILEQGGVEIIKPSRGRPKKTGPSTPLRSAQDDKDGETGGSSVACGDGLPQEKPGGTWVFVTRDEAEAVTDLIDDTLLRYLRENEEVTNLGWVEAVLTARRKLIDCAYSLRGEGPAKGKNGGRDDV